MLLLKPCRQFVFESAGQAPVLLLVLFTPPAPSVDGPANAHRISRSIAGPLGLAVEPASEGALSVLTVVFGVFLRDDC